MITILTANNCAYCVMAKNRFEENGIEYREVNMQSDRDQALNLYALSNYRGVPQFFREGEYLGAGYDKAKLIAEGEL